MTSKNSKQSNTPVRVVLALILAWIVPGAGHAFVGRPWRGVIIFLVIGATFWGGVALGGVMTVDYKEQKWWFAAEMLTGVHGLVGYQRASTQLEELEPQIQKAMAERTRSLTARIRESQQNLSQCNTEIAHLEQQIRSAETKSQRDMLSEDLDNRKKLSNELNGAIRGAYKKLNSLSSAHTTNVLSGENLALVAPMATLARAYAGVAGLLNLMCVFDAVMLAMIGTVAVADPSRREDDKQ